ncbi:MAG: ABC transporter substrate-binding protein [Planctomycetes bacterium]|nr:ABC transporter substrate-binding protein [Planctomycetota bacterium]
MSRKRQILLVALAGLLVVASLAWVAARISPEGDPGMAARRHVTDMTGRDVAIPSCPRRILSLCTSATDTMVWIGAGDLLAAIDEYGCTVPGVERAEVIGKGSAVSQEAILSRRIDLAFIWWYQDDAAAMLERLSVPVVRVRSARAAEVPAMIRLVGRCVGYGETADREAARVEQFLELAATVPDAAATTRPRVYLEMYGAYKTLGRDTYCDDLIRLAGGDNVAAEATGSVLLSAERLIHSAPDAVLLVEDFGDAATIAARPGMAELAAVRHGRVVALERRWLIAGPAMPEAVQRIRELLATAAAAERTAHGLP